MRLVSRRPHGPQRRVRTIDVCITVRSSAAIGDRETLQRSRLHRERRAWRCTISTWSMAKRPWTASGPILPDLQSVRKEALRAGREMLNLGGGSEQFWAGEPWRIWGTDEP